MLGVGLSLPVLAGTAALLVVAVGTGGALYLQRTREPATVDDIVESAGDRVDFKRPDVSGGLMDLVRLWRHRSREQKLAKKGYVKWIKIGSTVSRPCWVKPSQEGSGVPRYRENGETYYFPREALVTDSVTGAFVAMHYDGDADPINLRDSDLPALPTDQIERLINMEAESSAPGLLSGLDLTPKKLMGAMIALIVGYGLLMQVM
ncbi:hypothetical protein [Halobaculum sp. D14]|uniref:hypothetical protein n=1 Tax=Halobaculum sp. D14 TaxID=3421642 RepID=UPI003EBF45F6